nr:beta-lactamase [Aquisalinus luteolus]
MALTGLGATALLTACGRREQQGRITEGLLDLSEQEASLNGGHIGVFARDIATGNSLIHRADERFAMCSTFKWALAAQVLDEVQNGSITLDDEISFSEETLVPWSPVTGPLAAQGSASIRTLCEAAVAVSDNTAANLLLRLVDGPPGFTERLRGWGDEVTRLDRWETELNENAPGDPRDTTTPRAMAGLLERVAVGDIIAPAASATLRGWMEATSTGTNRLPAGTPDSWTLGHKTGTSNNGAVNDVGYFLRPDGAPIVIAVYVNAPEAETTAAEVVIAEVAEMTSELLG